MSATHQAVIIIGSGSAGLTAALYAARANLAPLVFEGKEPGRPVDPDHGGRQLPRLPRRHHGPRADGPDAQAGPAVRGRLPVGDRLRGRPVAPPVPGPDHRRPQRRPLERHDPRLHERRRHRRHRRLGPMAGPRRPITGATASAPAPPATATSTAEKRSRVVGGGDSAVEEATFLTKFATKVTLIHRRDTLRASKIMQDRVAKNPKIDYAWNSVVDEVIGEKQDGHHVLTGVKLRSTKDSRFAT